MATKKIAIGLKSQSTKNELSTLISTGVFTVETIDYIQSGNGQDYIKEQIKDAENKKDSAAAQAYGMFLNYPVEKKYIQFGQKLNSGILLSGMLPNDWVVQHKEEIKKLDLLCEHYGIAEGQSKYLDLSLALARELYPEGKPQKRPNKWTNEIRAILAVQMERLIVKGKKNKQISWAANHLAKEEPWKSFIEKREEGGASPNPGEVLRTQYTKSREIPGVKEEKVSLLKKSPEELKSYAILFVRKPRKN